MRHTEINAPLRKKPTKPKKCPLTPSGGGSWVKKINGRLYTFGPWHDLEGALKSYYSQVDFIKANGFKPAESDGKQLTVGDLANLFLECQDKRASLSARDDDAITLRHYNDLLHSCNLFVEVVKKSRLVEELIPNDFSAAKQKFSLKKDGSTASPATVAGHIRRVRAMFNWGYGELLFDRPPRYGKKRFRVPSKKAFRRHRNEQPEKLFSAIEIHEMIRLAPVTIKAAIWLGINCGLNNADVGAITLDVYKNRVGNWLHYPRNKTWVFRKLPLWDETVAAVETMLDARPQPSNAAAKKHLFLTRYGNCFGQSTISTEIKKLKRKLGIDRKGCGFNAMRHCIETFGGRDQVAVNVLLGHVDPHISAEYRELVQFPNDRLSTVTDNIRVWLGNPPVPKDKRGENE